MEEQVLRSAVLPRFTGAVRGLAVAIMVVVMFTGATIEVRAQVVPDSDRQDDYETLLKTAEEEARADREALGRHEDKDVEAGPYITQPRERYQVLVVGDSFAGGLWAGLTRRFAGDSRFELIGRYVEGTGLARPDIHDWNEAIKGVLERNTAHITIVMLGANDGQDMRLDGETLYFATQRWLRGYTSALDRFVKSLQAADTKVYWIGQPPMARVPYDEAMRFISSLHEQRASMAGFRFVNIRPQFADEQGNFAELAFDERTGTLQRIRSRDGVYFLKRGNDHLASYVGDIVLADVEKAEAYAAAQASDAASGVEVSNLPALGTVRAGDDETQRIEMEEDHDGIPDGLVITLRKQDKGGGAVGIATAPPRDNVAEMSSDGGVLGRDGLSALIVSARPGTAAAELFERGIAPPERAGRIDDFAWDRDGQSR